MCKCEDRSVWKKRIDKRIKEKRKMVMIIVRDNTFKLGLVVTCRGNGSSPFNVPDMFLPVSRGPRPQCPLVSSSFQPSPHLLEVPSPHPLGLAIGWCDVGEPIPTDPT